jgi:hypothetical protein
MQHRDAARHGLLVFALLASVATGAQPAQPAGQRVFVCGHSFHMPIAAMLEPMARAAGIGEHRLAGTQGIGGSTVTQHWDVPDPDNKVRAAIRGGAVDVLTLAPNRLLPDDAIDKFTVLLLQHNPKGRVTVQASWYPRDGKAGAGFKNAQRDDTDPQQLRQVSMPITDKLRAQVEALNKKLGTPQRPVVLLVPVGEAVTLLRERVAKGDVPGIARQSELFRDDLGHGKAPIYVLNAYCHHAVIYGQSPVGLPVPDALKSAGLGDHTAAVNRILQECAWKAVTGEPFSGLRP